MCSADTNPQRISIGINRVLKPRNNYRVRIRFMFRFRVRMRVKVGVRPEPEHKIEHEA